MSMEAYIYDGLRTPIGRYAGSLSSIRTDDLAALPLIELQRRYPALQWDSLDEVILGCANQAGEDNRNVARTALLLSGLPQQIAGITLNRLCASGLDAVAAAARSIRTGEANWVLAGGVESMSRAPFVMPKSPTAFARASTIYDTTIGWRFINPILEHEFGVDSMPQTAENVADDFAISRQDQDDFAYRSQQRWRSASASGFFAAEVFPVQLTQKSGAAIAFDRDEHPRPEITREQLTKLRSINREDGTVTAGNASGVNDGAAALMIANEEFGKRNSITPKARIVATVSCGVAPRIMGIGPANASKKILSRLRLSIEDMDVIELNEAFASQVLATLRTLGIPDDSDKVNPNGGAIALGHPLGMSGARLVMTATNELIRRQGRYALCTMCVGVGQGVAMILERV